MPGEHARERALVVAAAAGVLAGSWPVRDGLAGVDWRWLVPRVRALALPARLWAELVRAGLQGGLPPEVRAALEEDAQAIAAHALLVSEAMWRAGALLDRAGVAWMPMKGAALALVAPAYAAARAAADVDLVVRPDDLEPARRALAAALPLVNERRDYDGAERDADAAMRDDVQHLYAFRSAGGIPVELHHAFPGLTRRDASEGIFSRATARPARGASVLVPALDDLLGTACVHLFVGHPGDHRRLLRHLGDVTELVALGASPELARVRFDQDGRTTVAASLRALEEARADALTPGRARSAASLAVDPGAAGRLRAWAGKVGARAARMVGAFRQHGLGAVLPPRSFMVGIYGPAAAGRRLPLLHLHRWVGVLLRTIKGK